MAKILYKIMAEKYCTWVLKHVDQKVLQWRYEVLKEKY